MLVLCSSVFNLGNDTLLCTGGSLLLDPLNENAHYQWQNGSTDSTFTVTQSGTYSVQVSNQCGTASDTIVITFDTCVGIVSHIADINIQIYIYPNPAEGEFLILFPTENISDAEITVRNIIGEIIRKISLREVSGNSYVLNLSAQPAGIFFVNVKTIGVNVVQKIVLMR